MSDLGRQDLINAIGQARSDFTASVGPGATTTTIPLVGLSLGGVNMAGGYVLLDAGALGAGTPKTLAQIASNTATSLTLSSALSAAPAAGADLWLYTEAVVNVVATDNVAEWGGAAVAAADTTYGLVPEAVDLVPLTAISNTAANTDFAKFTAPWSGTATVLLSLPTASVVNFMVTPSGGTEANAGAIQDGATIAAAQPQTFSFPVSAGASYALQVATAQSGTLFVHVKGARR